MAREARFWDRMAKRYDEGARSESLQHAIDDAIAALGPDDVVLDLGCGSGPVAVEVRPHVSAVHGIDISPHMIALAKRHEAPGLTFDIATIDEPRLDQHGFTAIIAFNVLHFVDLDVAFRRFEELVPPGGLLIVAAACIRDVKPWTRAFLWVVGRLVRMPRMNRFSAAELEARVRGAAFTVEQSEAREAWAQVRWIVARREAVV